MKCLIFAAGLGTRLKPLTDMMPKALVPVGGMPLIGHVTRKLKASGVNEAVVNVHHFADMVQDWVENQDILKMNVSDERECLLETGGGVLHARPYLEGCGRFLIHNVDILSNLHLPTFIQTHNSNDAATLVVSQRETSRYLLFDENQRMCGWRNMKTNEVKPQELAIQSLHHLAFSGIQIISPQALQHLEQMPERFSIIDFYLHVMNTMPIRAYIPSEYKMIDVGKIDTLQAADHFLKTF